MCSCVFRRKMTKGAVALRCRSRDKVLVGALGTAESLIAAKKSHEIRNPSVAPDGFQHFKI